MAITPTDSLLAAPGKTTVYIRIFNAPRPPLLSPREKGQLLRADTFEEASRFAKCFVSNTNLQYVIVSAYSPLSSRQTSFEVARETFWNEDNKVFKTAWTMPAPAITQLTEAERATCPRPMTNQ